MKTACSSSDIEANEFSFDLRRALVTTEVGSKAELLDERRCPECQCLVGLSLFLTASQYDAYRVFLKALGIPARRSSGNVIKTSVGGIKWGKLLHTFDIPTAGICILKLERVQLAPGEGGSFKTIYHGEGGSDPLP